MLRIKRWDYFAIFTPHRFFSATIADLGYAGNIFVYTLDFLSHHIHEESLVIPISRGVQISRDTIGVSEFRGRGTFIRFEKSPKAHKVIVDWPTFENSQGINADLILTIPDEHESMNITIPIPNKRFYYNHKINCLPTEGLLHYGEAVEKIDSKTTLGQLDWGRGVWKYSSFWNWASASGFLEDRRTIGLNLGCGFGDTSAATENAIILNGKITKLNQVIFEYDSNDYLKPWHFRDDQNRLNLMFSPFKERLATTKLGIIDSEVHQMFGSYSGQIVTDESEIISIQNLIGFAEEHRARW